MDEVQHPLILTVLHRRQTLYNLLTLREYFSYVFIKNTIMTHAEDGNMWGGGKICKFHT
jgi:hypothetical protein